MSRRRRGRGRKDKERGRVQCTPCTRFAGGQCSFLSFSSFLKEIAELFRLQQARQGSGPSTSEKGNTNFKLEDALLWSPQEFYFEGA